MGKGKGSRAGRHAFVYPGTALAGASAMRPGTVVMLYRRLRVRCSFKLAVMQPTVELSQLTDF